MLMRPFCSKHVLVAQIYTLESIGAAALSSSHVRLQLWFWRRNSWKNGFCCSFMSVWFANVIKSCCFCHDLEKGGYKAAKTGITSHHVWAGVNLSPSRPMWHANTQMAQESNRGVQRLMELRVRVRWNLHVLNWSPGCMALMRRTDYTVWRADTDSFTPNNTFFYNYLAGCRPEGCWD